MSSLWLDLRYALRMMVRTPGLTAILLLTLAVGIGATTTIFSIVDSVVLRPLPYDRPEQLVRVYTELAGNTVYHDFPLAPAEYVDVARDCRSCATVAAWTNTTAALAGGDHPVAIRAARATHTLLPMIGVRPLLGRWFDAGEDRPGPPTVIVLGYDVWQRAFAGDRAIVGRSIRLDARPVTVIGVMPRDFDFLDRVEAWFPLGIDPARAGHAEHFLRVVARLAPGVTVSAIDAELAALIPGWAAQFQPDDPPPSPSHPIYVRPFQADLVKGVVTPIWLLQGAVLLVLVIAIVNVANLLITRAETRTREIAVRHALGASRRRLVRQLITESLVLGLCGGGLGVLAAVWGVDGMIAIIPRAAPRYTEIRLDGAAVAFAAGCAIASSLVFGIAPIVHARRVDLHGALKDGSSRMTGSRGGARFRRGLVIAEIALAIPLVIGCTVMVRGFLRSQRIEPGFAPDHLLTFGIALPRAAYPGTDGDLFWTRLEDRLRGLAGTRGVALLDGMPIISGDQVWQFELPGRPRAPGEPLLLVDQARVISEDALATLAARIVRGRGISAADGPGAPASVVINQTFAARYFPDQDPIGRQLGLAIGSGTMLHTIVGVFADLKQRIDQPPGTELMVPLRQYAQQFDPPTSAGSMVVAIRTAGDPEALIPAVQRAVAALDPSLPLIDLRSMASGMWQANARARILAQFLSVFAVLALALALVGIYGVIAHSVAQRTPEIGLRVALGARPAQVRAMVLRQAAALVAAGLALGLGAAVAIERALGPGVRDLFYGERLAQPALCAAVALAVIATALLATWIPVRRATRIEPTVALRNE
ncbi:MAG TPA: ABC transporter permease [Kofleriaceae bacterium]|nr:ABC transporter permease [Kofleriaceae bacterium]